MSHDFASVADTEDKKISFTEIGRGCYAFTAEGDPNTGVIIGDDAVLVVDAQATPAMAGKVIEKIRSVTDKPIKHLVLTHYHAVRVLGASAYGASEIIASDLTRRLIDERGEADWQSEYARFPRLFRDADTIPGLTRPTMTFASSMSVNLGNREVRIMHLGRGHTMGDAVVWVPDAAVMYSGDLVEYKSACYCGDAHLADWPRALTRISAFRPEALMPGRGDALIGREKVSEALALTEQFLTTLRDTTANCVSNGMGIRETYRAVKEVMDPLFADYAIYEHCLPFNVARAYDEAHGLDIPQVWTAERDSDLWDAIHGRVPAPAPQASSVEDVLEEPEAEEPVAEAVPEAEEHEQVQTDADTHAESAFEPSADTEATLEGEAEDEEDVIDLAALADAISEPGEGDEERSENEEVQRQPETV